MRHKVTEIKIDKFEKPGAKDLLGFCEFIVDGFQFRSVAIYKRADGGIRLSWPEKKRGIQRITTSFPIYPESAFEIESKIAEAMK